MAWEQFGCPLFFKDKWGLFSRNVSNFGGYPFWWNTLFASLNQGWKSSCSFATKRIADKKLLMSFQVCLGQVDRHELDVIGVTKLGKIFHWKFNPHSSTSPKIRILDQLVSIRFRFHQYLINQVPVAPYEQLFCT